MHTSSFIARYLSVSLLFASFWLVGPDGVMHHPKVMNKCIKKVVLPLSGRPESEIKFF
ncbi:hypothetical protein M378DRAFT_171488 [Amanita muscaria Koide BX008]|uniref:Uncharacterized protein n=1 Tax=Amanita muscaria (strain Koide BX008) TaxID=946122 RepID=A0A0C2SUD1_AMAMK|nr:hypothetical protein M378DRAFT_171488 [Amanita muscaria Koide BX008]